MFGRTMLRKFMGTLGKPGGVIAGMTEKLPHLSKDIKGFPVTRAQQVSEVANMATNVAAVGGAAIGLGVLSTYTLKKIKERIQNDTRRKAILSNLMEVDPIIGQADKDTVIEYYATIFHIAPKISLDKNAVRELLQAFIKFGRVDMATLKMLADTESKATSREFSPLTLVGSL